MALQEVLCILLLLLTYTYRLVVKARTYTAKALAPKAKDFLSVHQYVLELTYFTPKNIAVPFCQAHLSTCDLITSPFYK